MTQRVDLSTVMDRLSIDAVITGYAVAVDDGEWSDYRALFTADGRADYRTAGGIEGPAAEVADWLSQTMLLFPVRQHLIVNRRLDLQDLGGYPGDRARVQADYMNPMRLESGQAADGGAEAASADRPTAPNFVSGGRYAFELLRTDSGWRLQRVTVQEKWRSLTDPLTAG
ncbi:MULTISPECIES: nuclear transport factor 2 family protein [unclassified Streptomyces]|uniref:nuclear transport factor 2 family protein n=1 Tax=unclassified Streptomyces TaxID=2593676 RepID=UPI00225724B6|nr:MULTISPECIES: nuclear transport factor 2 family protein [unclassified Streptomyces]MCX5138774.1 nuclear transport factor 2 family protein [Streptomyces sp. NBC_00338]WRZ63488.1 nuclear transport factor 2 family protein [Streptomyces sp. NBC_01257]WSU57452.1 nuclear transport factor 2 family protein [Streptomyces sp. NBC_01104]